MLKQILEKIIEADVFQCVSIKPHELSYQQEIRDICKGNLCRKYGTTWACPPAVGTIEECKNRCLQYNTMLAFTGKFTLEDCFDYEGMKRGMVEFKQITRKVESAVKPYLKDYLLLSNEGCITCTTCTYPYTACRFPEQLHHSIEGYGILVSELAHRTGINYNNGQNTVTYFGALLFNDTDAQEDLGK